MDSLQGILNADLDEAKNYVRRLKQDNKANFRKTSCEPCHEGFTIIWNEMEYE